MASRTLLAKSFTLTSDIAATGNAAWNAGAGLNPIGGGPGNAFTGSFDGRGISSPG